MVNGYIIIDSHGTYISTSSTTYGSIKVLGTRHNQYYIFNIYTSIPTIHVDTRLKQQRIVSVLRLI